MEGEQRKEKERMYIVRNQSESKSAWLQKWGMIMKCADSSLTQKGQVSEHLNIYSITQIYQRKRKIFCAHEHNTTGWNLEAKKRPACWNSRDMT